MSTETSQSLKSALREHQAGRFDAAALQYRQVLDAEPGNADALYLLGVLNLQTGNTDAALDLVSRAIVASPGQADYHNMRGEVYRQRRDYGAAIACYEQAISLRPDFAGAYLNLGNVFQESDRLEQAARSYEQVLRLDSGLPMAHNNLGVVCNRLGRMEEAASRFRRAIELMPDYADAYTNLGNLHQEQDDPATAAEYHRKAAALMPGFAEAHSNLGRALTGLGRLDEAMACFRKAIALDPRLSIAHNNLGIVLDELRRPDEAIECYELALELEPDYADAHNNLGNVLDQVGRIDDAIRHFSDAIRIDPGFAEARRHLARLRPGEDQLADIAACLSDPATEDSSAMHLRFAQGEIYQKRLDYDAAFSSFSEGNRLKRASASYDPDVLSARVDWLIRNHSAGSIADYASYGDTSERPVFIVGMPRSGSTLVEQIVASHPDAWAAGELEHMQDIERSIERELTAGRTAPGQLIRNHARQYLDRLPATDARRVCDKAPGNFLRIGLIKALFPRARIVHCHRNALDTCTSVYLTYFVSGHEFSCDLGDIARYYIDYARLMQHWDRLFAPDMLHLRYEDLVHDQRSTSMALISYLGLDWDSACLDYFRSAAPVRTASSAQVRRKIYTDSVDRWKRYATHLTALTDRFLKDGASMDWAAVAHEFEGIAIAR